MATALVAPNVVGYSFDQAPNLADSRERKRLSGSAIKVFVNIVGKWALNEAQARGLLGGVASSTFHSWKTKPKGKELDQDTLTRISLIIGIYKALHIYFGKPWADRWITLKIADLSLPARRRLTTCFVTVNRGWRRCAGCWTRGGAGVDSADRGVSAPRNAPAYSFAIQRNRNGAGRGDRR